MAMCIDLMQDQMITKFKIISEKLGISGPSEAHEIEENEINEEHFENKNEMISRDGKVESPMASKSDKLRMQLDSIRMKNKSRNMLSSRTLDSADACSSNMDMPEVENKRIVVKSLNETRRNTSTGTEC